MQLVFESRVEFSDFTGHLRFEQCRPTIHPEPVLRPDSLADAKGLSIYGSVLQEGGTYRMWYQAMPATWNGVDDMASIAYAESEDGIHWRKPNLGQVELDSQPTNLLKLAFHCPSVFRDTSKGASGGYHATGCSYPELFMAPPELTKKGYYTAHSSDGLDWEFDSYSPRWDSADVITSIYHPGQQRGIVALKHQLRVQRMLRRCIHTAEFKDGIYSDAVSALYPDEYDDILAGHRGYNSCDYYGMGMQATGSGTVGFLWNYWHGLPYTGECQFALYGASEVTLVYQSEAGGRWQHVPGRPIFIENTEYPRMRGWLNTASCPVEAGDEHRLYFSSTEQSHGMPFDVKWQPIDKWKEWAGRYCQSSIGFVSWPKWRLFGFAGDPYSAFTIDLGIIEEPSELWLNYKAHIGGSVSVEIQGDPQRGLQDSIVLTGNSTGERAGWKCGTVLPQTNGSPCKVRLTLEQASVYAYEVRPVKA